MSGDDRPADPRSRSAVPATGRTVLVMGARGSGAGQLASLLRSRGAGRGLTVLTPDDAAPGAAPSRVVVAVDAVCPIRPDDLTVVTGLSARFPVVVVMVDPGRSRDPATAVTLTAERLRAAGTAARVVMLVSGDPRTPVPAGSAVTAEGLVDLLVSPPETVALPAPDRHPVTVPAPGPERPDDPRTTPSAPEIVDWLLARRTELITARSSALRQDVQALRMDLVQDLHGRIRELGSRARQEIGQAPARRLPQVVDRLSGDATRATRQVLARADRLTEALVVRHLGVVPRQAPALPTPRADPVIPPAPRHRTEETLMVVMGAAGGTGVGRMLLSPLAELPATAAAVLPLSLAAGLGLGAVTVAVRRTQSGRAHLVAVTSDRLAGLRAETEQLLGARLLAAEAQVTDGFVHDPGPRVADLERRLRRLRTA